MDEFIKKDLFDLHIQRMEALMEANLAKHDSIAADMRLDNVRLEGKIDSLSARLDTLQSRFAWNLAWVGIIMGLVLAIVQNIWR